MYTYLIGWRELDMWYYGVRTANTEEPDLDIWVHYFTSSKFVQEFRELHGEPDVIRVHKRFNSREEAVAYEMKFLRRIGAVTNPRFLNKSIGGSSGFHHGINRTEETYRKISEKLRGRSFRSGYKLTDETKAKIRVASASRKHSEETKALMSRNRKGRKAWNKGIPFSEESRKKMSASAKHEHVCPHCHKSGGNVMFRWHFDNCKAKVTNA